MKYNLLIFSDSEFADTISVVLWRLELVHSWHSDDVIIIILTRSGVRS